MKIEPQRHQELKGAQSLVNLGAFVSLWFKSLSEGSLAINFPPFTVLKT